MEMMASDGTRDLSNLRTAIPSAPCTDSAAAGSADTVNQVNFFVLLPIRVPTRDALLAAPLELNADLLKSAAVQFPIEEIVPLQLNIFSEDSRHFNIVSEVRRLPDS